MKNWNFIFFVCSFLLLATPSKATHIVGGEFELLHLSGNRYTLNLILYSDMKNIDPGNPIDPYAVVHIWSKDNRSAPIESKTLWMKDQKLIPYTNPKCVIPELETSKTIYTAVITLDPEVYNNSSGYYINYERCCRNGVINNIKDPGAVGQAFYLEFPAVVKDGKPFINSSPYLFPPLSDFARLGYPFYFDFSGTDADGDELVYSLTTPLAGSSSPDQGNILPPPRPAPYAPIQWVNPYHDDNMVPGNPNLQITPQGIIKITPTQTGLFVFAVKVEEYRKGIKIGEVRREFQMLVYSYTGNDNPPQLSAQKEGEAEVYKKKIELKEGDFSDFENNRCITLTVKDDDIDAPNAPNKGREPFTFKIRPVDFNMTDPEELLSTTTGHVDKINRSFDLQLCLPACPPRGNRSYTFDVIAYDDACAVPLTDTLRVTVIPPKIKNNTAPKTSTSLSASPAKILNIERTLGEEIKFDVYGTDKDDDLIYLRAEGDGFLLNELGIGFLANSGRGSVSSSFDWKTDCNNMNRASKTNFTVFFITEDRAFCNIPNPDTVTVNFTINPPPNASPYLRILGSESTTVEATVGSELVFELVGVDSDLHDIISLSLDSISSVNNGNMLDYSWMDVDGSVEVKSTLVLAPDCSIFSDGARERSFTFYFSLRDNPCLTSQTDTISLKVIFRERELDFNEVNFINVFTPNDDQKNDFFEIHNLPEDACFNKLENIIVYNRWGKILYKTTNKNFKWDGENYPDGIYFYQVQYTHTTFKSSLTLIRGDKTPISQNQ